MNDTFNATSSANAKKWEVELQTLKNNNARLTTALQESTANVEEWKKQLSAYKEESARMKKKVHPCCYGCHLVLSNASVHYNCCIIAPRFKLRACALKVW